MAAQKTPKLKPCPCCGNKQFYTGHTSSCNVGIICNECGLRISRPYPPEMPNGVGSLKKLDEFLLKGAAEAWNRRVD